MVPNPQDRSERSNPEENQTPLTTDREGFREGRGVIVVRRGFITVSLHPQTFQ